MPLFSTIKSLEEVLPPCSNFQIYFSNEEDKFGDDRRVDFAYMPDLAIERPRNVSVRLKGQHGKYVMVQLYFAAKWMLVSEVTFVSGEGRYEVLDSLWHTGQS